MKIIVGLGNPGKEYAKTRHNLGWLVLDKLAGKNKWQENKKAKALFLAAEIDGQEALLVKPTTFMNNSGLAVRAMIKKYNLKPSDLIVVHDDKDLDFGRIKVTGDSGSAGHNGVKSLIDVLGTQKFIRVRVGVKNELLEKMPTDKFVLGRFNKEEIKQLDNILKEIIAKICQN
ncbi:MAG: aminoacyl-tRNA hydrolase [Patescibacteria group bacterium]|jgi:PTH1 family peptidyl-tRNA hydrolase